ncbi:MAG TPA: hypothetical protein IAB45_02985 [Candidatus Onthousia faecavium]|nr:hypothetical protein [Candidatus Onthousia faecavium]
MDILKDILNAIMDVYNQDLDNETKHNLLSSLWTKYYKLSSELDVSLPFAYNLYLLGENESYIIYQEPESKKIDRIELDNAINHYNDIKKNGFKEGLTFKEIETLLDYSVSNARSAFSSLGIDIKTNSLNGFCELGQALTIMPFEKLEFEVTKNSASKCFDYPFNHVFGTVSFPYQDSETVKTKTYLIDVTYRQFFTTNRCNEGRYYTEEENTGLLMAPDPGYFVEDALFAKTLMKDGYIELTDENAKKYGEAFYKAGIPLKDLDRKSMKQKDYYTQIIFDDEDYVVNRFELEGINLEFPIVDREKYINGDKYGRN